jgi:hypothetical protein
MVRILFAPTRGAPPLALFAALGCPAIALFIAVARIRKIATPAVLARFLASTFHPPNLPPNLFKQRLRKYRKKRSF